MTELLRLLDVILKVLDDILTNVFVVLTRVLLIWLLFLIGVLSGFTAWWLIRLL